jgi:hypothetical protein
LVVAFVEVEHEVTAYVEFGDLPDFLLLDVGHAAEELGEETPERLVGGRVDG